VVLLRTLNFNHTILVDTSSGGTETEIYMVSERLVSAFSDLGFYIPTNRKTNSIFLISQTRPSTSRNSKTLRPDKRKS
jgi:hypothetical protein